MEEPQNSYTLNFPKLWDVATLIPGRWPQDVLGIDLKLRRQYHGLGPKMRGLRIYLDPVNPTLLKTSIR